MEELSTGISTLTTSQLLESQHSRAIIEPSSSSSFSLFPLPLNSLDHPSNISSPPLVSPSSILSEPFDLFETSPIPIPSSSLLHQQPQFPQQLQQHHHQQHKICNQATPLSSFPSSNVNHSKMPPTDIIPSLAPFQPGSVIPGPPVSIATISNLQAFRNSNLNQQLPPGPGIFSPTTTVLRGLPFGPSLKGNIWSPESSIDSNMKSSSSSISNTSSLFPFPLSLSSNDNSGIILRNFNNNNTCNSNSNNNNNNNSTNDNSSFNNGTPPLQQNNPQPQGFTSSAIDSSIVFNLPSNPPNSPLPNNGLLFIDNESFSEPINSTSTNIETESRPREIFLAPIGSISSSQQSIREQTHPPSSMNENFSSLYSPGLPQDHNSLNQQNGVTNLLQPINSTPPQLKTLLTPLLSGRPLSRSTNEPDILTSNTDQKLSEVEQLKLELALAHCKIGKMETEMANVQSLNYSNSTGPPQFNSNNFSPFGQGTGGVSPIGNNGNLNNDNNSLGKPLCILGNPIPPPPHRHMMNPPPIAAFPSLINTADPTTTTSNATATARMWVPEVYNNRHPAGHTAAAAAMATVAASTPVAPNTFSPFTRNDYGSHSGKSHSVRHKGSNKGKNYHHNNSTQTIHNHNHGYNHNNDNGNKNNNNGNNGVIGSGLINNLPPPLSHSPINIPRGNTTSTIHNSLNPWVPPADFWLPPGKQASDEVSWIMKANMNGGNLHMNDGYSNYPNNNNNHNNNTVHGNPNNNRDGSNFIGGNGWQAECFYNPLPQYQTNVSNFNQYNTTTSTTAAAGAAGATGKMGNGLGTGLGTGLGIGTEANTGGISTGTPTTTEISISTKKEATNNNGNLSHSHGNSNNNNNSDFEPDSGSFKDVCHEKNKLKKLLKMEKFLFVVLININPTQFTPQKKTKSIMSILLKFSLFKLLTL